MKKYLLRAPPHFSINHEYNDVLFRRDAHGARVHANELLDMMNYATVMACNKSQTNKSLSGAAQNYCGRQCRVVVIVVNVFTRVGNHLPVCRVVCSAVKMSVKVKKIYAFHFDIGVITFQSFIGMYCEPNVYNNLIETFLLST